MCIMCVWVRVHARMVAVGDLCVVNVAEQRCQAVGVRLWANLSECRFMGGKNGSWIVVLNAWEEHWKTRILDPGSYNIMMISWILDHITQPSHPGSWILDPVP